MQFPLSTISPPVSIGKSPSYSKGSLEEEPRELFDQSIESFRESHHKYGTHNVLAYADYSKLKHGPDGGLFLDPYFIPLIQGLNGEKVLDIGCGAGPWSIYAAKNGGIVSAIDIQPEMIAAAKTATQSASLSEDKVRYCVGDAGDLPYANDFFDRTISICVGCNLPQEIFNRHIEEIRRTLKKDGIGAIGVPTSLHVVFSDGSKSEEAVHAHIQEVLALTPDNPSREKISEELSKLTEVLSATFYVNKTGRLTLLTNEHEIPEGTKVWRKLPKPVVPNFYYKEESYQQAISAAKLTTRTLLTPHFTLESDRVTYNNTAPSHENLITQHLFCKI